MVVYIAAGCSTHVDLTEDSALCLKINSVTLCVFVIQTLPGKVIQLFIDEKGIDCKNNTRHKRCLITGPLTMSSPVRREQGRSGPLSEHVRGRLRYNVTAGETICPVNMPPFTLINALRGGNWQAEICRQISAEKPRGLGVIVSFFFCRLKSIPQWTWQSRTS